MERLAEIALDLRTIISGAVLLVIASLVGVRNWVQSGKGAAIIIAWAVRKMVTMFSDDDSSSIENRKQAETIVQGLMNLPVVKSKIEQLNKLTVDAIDTLEAELLHLKKEHLDIENRLELKIDSESQQEKMIALKAELENKIKDINDKIKS